MESAGAGIDTRMQAALGRLTDNEKECLRRRLQQQTAKEMALELGVSPHAVEKRLKMARTKLGLSSSLDAARLLAVSEGYQRTGPQGSELGFEPQAEERRSHQQLVRGTAIVILAAAAAFVLAARLTGDIADSEVPSAAGSTATVVPRPFDQGEERITPSPTEMELLVIYNFDLTDKDRSGYIEPAEISERNLDGPTYARNEDGTFRHTGFRRPSRSEFVAPYDRDRDGKWNRDEFREWLTPHLRAGVPAKMRGHIESLYRQ